VSCSPVNERPSEQPPGLPQSDELFAAPSIAVLAVTASASNSPTEPRDAHLVEAPPEWNAEPDPIAPCRPEFDLRVVRELPEYDALLVELRGAGQAPQRHAVFVGAADRSETLALTRALYAMGLLSPRLYHIVAWTEPLPGWTLVLDGAPGELAELRRAVAPLSEAFPGIVVYPCGPSMRFVAEAWDLGVQDDAAGGRS
jgi:hypothetical protein